MPLIRDQLATSDWDLLDESITKSMNTTKDSKSGNRLYYSLFLYRNIVNAGMSSFA